MKLINEKHNIYSCKVEELPRSLEEGGKLEHLVFYYKNRDDVIVMNENHVNYDVMSEIVPSYMEFDDIQRKTFAAFAAEVNNRILISLKVLHEIIRIRRNLQKSKIRKVGVA